LKVKKTIFIVLDNLRIGGIQRLALDEAYSFNRQGNEVSIIILEEPKESDDIREIDGGFFEIHKMKIIIVPHGRIRQIKWFISLLRKRNPQIIFSHSASGIGLIKLASLLSLRKTYIVGFLHQLASLSSFSQKVKRFLLFAMADQVRASSKQFIMEFDIVYRKLGFLNTWILRKMHFDRMGIDLTRINWVQRNESLIPIVGQPALVFNSRVTEWKGFKTFVDLAHYLGPEFQYILITSRMIH